MASVLEATVDVSVAHLRAAVHHTNLFTFRNVHPIDFAGHGVEALCEHAVLQTDRRLDTCVCLA